MKHPIGVFHCKNIVEKNLVKNRSRKPRQNHAKPQDKNKKKSRFVLQKFRGNRFNDAVTFTLFLKVFAGTNFQKYSGKRAEKILPRNFSPPHCRVVNVNGIAFVSFKHDEMIKFPEQNQRKVLHDYGLRNTCAGFGLATQSSCRLQNILSVGAVTSNAAFLTQFFKRNPLSVMRQYHCQRCRAAFDCLHL